MKKTMKKKTLFGLLSLMLVGLIASTGIVSAFAGGHGVDDETRDIIKTAIEEGDYETWKSTIESSLTEERFNEIVERKATKEAVKSSLEAGDYDAYLDAVQGLDTDRAVWTEEEFNQKVDRFEQRQNDDGENNGFRKHARFHRFVDNAQEA